MINRYEMVIRKLVVYENALEDKKDSYSKQLDGSILNLSEQEHIYDAVFIVDYMLEINRIMIVYLRFLQKTNNGLAIKVRDNLFDSNEDHSNLDIHTLAECIRRQIITENLKLIRALLVDCLRKIEIARFIYHSVIPIVCCLGGAFFLGSLAYLPTLISLTVMLAAVWMMNDYLKKIESEVSEIEESLINPISVMRQENYQKTMTHYKCGEPPISREWTTETIRHNFFHKKAPGSTATISTDVTAVYRNLMQI